MQKTKKLIILGICAATTTPACASTLTRLGDYTQVIVPAYAFGLAMNEDGWTGAQQFALSLASTEIAVYGLKAIIKEQRPNKKDNNSFPSGHTASAFSGATFIHKRYGIKQAIYISGIHRIHPYCWRKTSLARCNRRCCNKRCCNLDFCQQIQPGRNHKSR